MENIQNLIREEKRRQEKTLCMIPSENHPDVTVRSAVGSILTTKYAEGYPGKRYYEGNAVVDKVEREAKEAAEELFGADHANVQPYSGSVANFALYLGFLEPGDTVLGFDLNSGGHLTHGSPVNFSGKLYNVETYGLNDSNRLDPSLIRKKAEEVEPNLIISGTTSYPRKIPFEEIGKIAEDVGAYHVADISHISGLVVAGLHEDPVPHSDAVMTTTHKILRGPRGAIILCKDQHKGRVDKAVFPGVQGGPHMNSIAGKAIALQNCTTDEFKQYANRVKKNAKALEKTLLNRGVNLVSGGTETHMVLVDLSSRGVGSGKAVAEELHDRNIVCNANTIPNEQSSPRNPSGIRLGTPAITTRGLREGDMPMVGNIIADVILGEGEKDEHLATVKRITKTYSLPR